MQLGAPVAAQEDLAVAMGGVVDTAEALVVEPMAREATGAAYPAEEGRWEATPVGGPALENEEALRAQAEVDS